MRIAGRRARLPWGPLLALCTSAALVLACGGGGGGKGGSPLVSQDLSSVTPNPITAAHNSSSGDFAADYLRGTHFTSLFVEVDYAASRPPTQAALDFLQQRLTERCDKAMSVIVAKGDAIPDAAFKSVMSVTDVEVVEDAHRNTFSDLAAKSAALYILYAKGASDLDGPSGKILGISHRGGSIVIFIDNAISMGTPFFTSLDFEAYGIVHESGHCLGLVNNGVPMVNPHEAAAHPQHDVDPSSVMYWSITASPLDPVLGDANFAQFGPDCLLDMHAFGGN